jgi:unsaturated rhamnogalacturonyl hydrolase
MGALFLAKWGIYSKNDMYLHEAIRQFLLHYHYLTDKDTGLLFHGYSCDLRTHLSGVRWGRANGWGLIACVIILPLIPDSFKEKERILNLYRLHAETMVKYQNPDGSFHTVLDHPSTYKETTVASAFSFSLFKAVKLGYLEEKFLAYANLSLDYIKQNISSDGIVEKTSGGTPIMSSIEEYNKIPYSVSYYGQGMAVMALNEVIF